MAHDYRCPDYRRLDARGLRFALRDVIQFLR